MAGTLSNSEEISLIFEEKSTTVSHPDLDAKIAEIAYFKAESRGFEEGYELDDWLEAEQGILL